jgi:hypothetical protein
MTMTTRNVLRIEARSTRESGNAILLVVLLLGLLAVLSAVQFIVTHKNLQASTFFLDTADLRKYAESGIDLALHDLSYEVSETPGVIGISSWTTADDVGRDGRAGTLDEGEGDGIATHGEPNVSPVAIGSPELGARLSTQVFETDFPGVVRVVSTASNAGASATVDVYARSAPATLPRAGAIFVDLGVALDLNGRSFLVDGRDHNLDGSLRATLALPGISTPVGDPAGSNQIALLAQIPAVNYPQIKGIGASPSLGEQPIDLKALIEEMKKLTTKTLVAGTYTGLIIGDPTKRDLPVTYVDGDLHLSGRSSGGGVLIVDGSVTMTGTFNFQGLILVSGDVRLSGGGAGIHILGSIMVEDSLTAVDLGLTETKLSGNSEVYYSSEAIDRAQAALPTRYSIAYYNDG